MNKYIFRLFTVIVAVVASTTVKAQELDLDAFLQAGVEDAKKMAGDYMEPAFVGFGYGMNSGWYNTGQPHKLLGFDITGGLSFAFVPSSAKTYEFKNSDYTNVQLRDGASAQLPTIFGENLPADELPLLSFLAPSDIESEFIQPGDELIAISAPTGAGIEEADWYPLGNVAVPAPFAQVGIGLIKGTEVKLRIVPEQEFDGASFGMFGLGIMHDIKQWIPGTQLLPFDLSGFFAFSRYNSSFGINPDQPDQVVELSGGGTTIQGIISKKLAILTVYAGLGVMTTSTDFDMLGSYTVEFQDTPLVDPLSFSYSSGGPRANIGARIKLLVLTVHAEYALQKYNTFTLGVGISVR